MEEECKNPEQRRKEKGPTGSRVSKYVLRHPDRHNAFRMPEIISLLQMQHGKGPGKYKLILPVTSCTHSHTVLPHKNHKDAPESPRGSITTKSEPPTQEPPTQTTAHSKVAWMNDGDDEAEGRSYRSLTFLECSENSVRYLLGRCLLLLSASEILCASVGPPPPSLVRDSLGAYGSRKPFQTYKLGSLKHNKVARTIVGCLEEKTVDLDSPEAMFDLDVIGEVYVLSALVAESGRKKWLGYALKKRSFIGTTAMDNEIAFLMANICGVSHTSLVVDYFAGTGSLLLPCAIIGARVIGADLSPKQFTGMQKHHKNPKVRTRLPNTDIYSNFEQLSVTDHALGFAVSDVFGPSILRPNTVTCIVFDPPYGAREGLGHAGGTNKRGEESEDTENPTAISISGCSISTPSYFIQRVFEHALSVLRAGGRVCFFLPHSPSVPAPRGLPVPPEFTLLFRCFQPLNSKRARTLYVYKKEA